MASLSLLAGGGLSEFANGALKAEGRFPLVIYSVVLMGRIVGFMT